MVPRVPTVPTTMDHRAAVPVPRFHTRPPTIATNRPPTRMSYAMVRAATTSGTTIASPSTTAPSSSTQPRFEASSAAVSGASSSAVAPSSEAVASPRRMGRMSVRITVEAAMIAPEAVDIMAATAAARATPPTPTGSRFWATHANTSSVVAMSAVTVRAAMPIRAPATPYTMQYSPAVAPPIWATRGERAVNTRCQTSWPISRPRV